MAVDVVDPHKVNEQLSIARSAISEWGSSTTAAPERRKRYLPLISADDHLVEPPHLFEGRLPKKYAERTPRVIEREGGSQAWLLDSVVLDQIAINAVAGTDLEDVDDLEEQVVEPMRFEHARQGTWDIKARIADMDLDGVYASLNFPSALGFGGLRLTMLDDPDYVLALVRAYNDWHLEEWAGYRPERIIPCQIPYLFDPVVGAEEVRRNAARGFHTVTFPDLTHLVGLPSLHTDHWDPFFAACEETGTVISIHACSGGMANKIDPAAPMGAHGVFFGVAQSIHPAIEWLFAGIPQRFPDLKICLSEGGIGWVVGFMDRLDHDNAKKIPGRVDRKEIVKRNFVFCMLDDPSTLHRSRDIIGVERIVLETDYPHSDSSWPDTQEKWHRQFEGIPADEVAMMAWKNMSELFQHPVPAEIVADPELF